jgi:hypothetical protein
MTPPSPVLILLRPKQRFRSDGEFSPKMGHVLFLQLFIAKPSRPAYIGFTAQSRQHEASTSHSLTFTLAQLQAHPPVKHKAPRRLEPVPNANTFDASPFQLF